MSQLSKLSGSQQEKLQKALLSAFSTYNALRQMVQNQLDENLDHITKGPTSPLGDVVFDLVEWAKERGYIPKLLDGALKANPTNPSLRAIVDEMGQASISSRSHTIIITLIILTIIIGLIGSLYNMLFPNLYNSKKPVLLERIDFEYQDSPIQHGWEIIEGDESHIEFEHISDQFVGTAIAISLPTRTGLEIAVKPATGQSGKFIEFVTDFKNEQSFFYVNVGLKKDNLPSASSMLKVRVTHSENNLKIKT